MAIPPVGETSSTVDAAVETSTTTEQYSVMHSCNAVSINAINSGSSNNPHSSAGVGSQLPSCSGPNCINSFSMNMSSVDRQDRKSVAASFINNRYINYWTGAETNELPLAYAPTGK